MIRLNTGFKFKPFSKKQKQILTWWMPKSKVKDYNGIIADGAIRSGKTVSMGLSFVIWAMETFNGENFAMCGKTVGSFRRNVLIPLKKMLITKGYKVTELKSENLVTVERKGKVNYFYIFGGRDERSQDLIQGVTLAGVLFDEVALMPESFVNQATGRCSIEGSKMWFNCNPKEPNHWFYKNWIQEAKNKKMLYIHFMMEDNLSLTERIKQRYRSMYTGVFYKRYILGIWIVAEGAIYDMFNRKKNTYKDTEENIINLKYNSRRFISIDYGTANATVFLDWHDSGKEVLLDREYYWDSRKEGRQKTDEEYADDLEKFVNKDEIERVIIDPSAASFIAVLKQRGWRVKTADNEVIDGIRMTSTMISKRFLIVNEECQNTIDEMESYRWDEKASMKGKEQPIKDKDHAMDAMRYFIKTIIKAWRLQL